MDDAELARAKRLMIPGENPRPTGKAVGVPPRFGFAESAPGGDPPPHRQSRWGPHPAIRFADQSSSSSSIVLPTGSVPPSLVSRVVPLSPGRTPGNVVVFRLARR